MPGCKHRHPILSTSHIDTASADVPSDGDVLTYEGATELWRPIAPTVYEPLGAVATHAAIPEAHHAPFVQKDAVALIVAHAGLSSAHHAPGVAAHNILDGDVHSDSVAVAAARGALIVGNATPKWDRLTKGAANSVLCSNGTDLAWQTAPKLGSIRDTAGVTRHTFGATNTITGMAKVTGHFGVVSDPAANWVFNVFETMALADTTGLLRFGVYHQPPAAAYDIKYGILGLAQIDTISASAWAHTLRAVSAVAEYYPRGADDLGNMIALYAATQTVTAPVGSQIIACTIGDFSTGLGLGSCRVVTMRGIWLHALAGTVTTGIAIDIEDWSAATTSRSIRVVGSAISIHQPALLIGANAAPVTSALLELQSTTKAILISRMTTAQRDALTAVNGMGIYNTTTAQFEKYQAGAWIAW